MIRGSRENESRGAVMLIVLVCLTVATTLFSLVLRRAAEQRQALRLSHWDQQARWLAEAGVERAAARLAADPQYAGETWRVPARDFAGGAQGGAVRIRVAAVAGRPERRAVEVEADYPDDPEQRCRRAARIFVDLAARDAANP